MKKIIVLSCLIIVSSAYAARTFNGTTQYAQTTYAHAGTPPLSFSCWFYPDVNNAGLAVWSLSDADGTADYIAVFVDGTSHKMEGIVRTIGGHSDVFSNATVSTGEWHHVAFVWDGDSDAYLYLDGDPNDVHTTWTPSNISDITIGRITKETPSAYFDGRISDAGFWSNYALTSADVNNLYTNLYSPELVGTPTITWRLDEENATDNVVDDVSGTYTLTQYNSPTVSAGPEGIVYSLGVEDVNYYVYSPIVGGDETGVDLANAWPDIQKAVTYFAANSPISLDQNVTVYCWGDVVDANVPIVGTIATDTTHTITFVGDLPTGHAYSTDYYHIVGADCMLWTIDSNYVTLQNLQMQLTSEDGAGDGCLTITTPHATANLVQVKTSVFRGDNINDQDDIAITSTDTGTNLYWYRNAIYDVNEGTDLLVNCKMSFTDSQPSGGGGSIFSGVVQ